MTNHSSTTKPPVLVAIDIAKHRHDVLVKDPNGKSHQFKVANSSTDFDRFCSFLRSFGHPCHIAFEPTADYHRLIAWRLLSDGHHVFLASSVACSRAREAIYNSRDKNDPKDTRVIMYLLESGIVMTYHDPLANGINDLQEVSNTYSVTTFRRTQLLHSIKNHYITLYFPEIEKLFHSTRAAWFTRTFSQFPTPSSITALSQDEFVSVAYPLVGRKVNKVSWLNELYYTAQCSIGLPIEPNCVAANLFRTMLLEYAGLTELRDSLEAQANDLLSDNPDFALLQTIPGIGPIVALTILAEGGDLRRFQHHRQFLKYCGLDLATYQSGKSKSAPRLSKRGNSRLRLAFWQAANSAIRQYENSFQAKFSRYVRTSPDDPDIKRKARVAVAAKMARVAHAIVKRGTPYQPYFESGLPSEKIPLARAVEANTTS